MKGVSTVKKLDILYTYFKRKSIDGLLQEPPRIDERYRCQVDNYLGALRRGGLLDMNNLIVR